MLFIWCEDEKYSHMNFGLGRLLKLSYENHSEQTSFTMFLDIVIGN